MLKKLVSMQKMQFSLLFKYHYGIQEDDVSADFYIVSETPMLRNDFFMFFFSIFQYLIVKSCTPPSKGFVGLNYYISAIFSSVYIPTPIGNFVGSQEPPVQDLAPSNITSKGLQGYRNGVSQSRG